MSKTQRIEDLEKKVDELEKRMKVQEGKPPVLLPLPYPVPAPYPVYVPPYNPNYWFQQTAAPPIYTTRLSNHTCVSN